MATYETLIIPNAAPVKAWTRGVPVEGAALQQLANVARLPFIHRWVAAMPDVHYGIGATVGSVIPTKQAIIPAAVGVDIGCFAAETRVPVADGTERPIKELADSGREFIIYSCTTSQRIVAARATAKLTRRNAELMKVTLDNGEVIRCTPDHEFMLRDGTFCQAKDLAPGTSLMPFYSKSDKDGYTLIQQPYSGWWQKAHWIVARSALLGSVPAFPGQRTVIHHKNFQQADNTPENLEFMGEADHSAYHRQLIERNMYWQSAGFEERRVAALRAKAQTPEGHQFFAERGAENLRCYMTERREEFLAAVAGNGQRGKEYLSRYNTSEQGRAKSRELAARVHACETCGESVRSYLGLHNHRRRSHGYNHRVTAVEPLSEREDVYCLTVPDYGNFALAAGVFVHNCGMVAARTSLRAEDLPDSLNKVRSGIEKAVPHGRTDRGGKNDKGAWGKLPARTEKAWRKLAPGYQEIVREYPSLDRGQSAGQLGTLGSGNHFIEICLDESNHVWIMLHSGSRGVGNRIGSQFIELAKKDLRRQGIDLPDRDLAYFSEGSRHFDDYWFAVDWAQRYARANRELMLESVVDVLTASPDLPRFRIESEVVNCHHNYVARERHYGEEVYVTRKGAVRAGEGELGIIPGSMGARSYIVRGKGNPESFHSCSHGAGRAMSRGEAKRRFTIDDHIAATAGVECRKDAGVIDETPAAYKDIDAVMAAQQDLVEIVHTLRQIVCVKG